jgi:hypothetical protein
MALTIRVSILKLIASAINSVWLKARPFVTVIHFASSLIFQGNRKSLPLRCMDCSRQDCKYRTKMKVKDSDKHSSLHTSVVEGFILSPML